MTPATRDDGASLRLLGVAPHRLLFFVGATNLLLAMLWWTAWLASSRWRWPLPEPALYAGWLHASIMQYQMLPSFMFGFLLTVFPRWMNLPELPPRRYVPVGVGLLAGQLLTLIGALGSKAALLLGWALTAAGWLAGLGALAPLLWKEPGKTWHARSCFAALLLGALGLACLIVHLLGGTPLWLFASVKLGTFGLLLPIYFTVAHRMFPFFASNVVIGYVSWRPLTLLGVFWALVMLHLSLELLHAYRGLWIPDLALLGLTAWSCWRWWPRAGPGTSVPPLLLVLFLGLAWLPVAFALYASQSLFYLLTGAFALGRAPAHALFVGFFGSVLVAMVTRVTQGHSGRPLVLPRIAWCAFIAVQVVALTRIVADLLPDGPLWQAVAAAGWLLALGPWALRLASIYVAPRADGKAG